MSGVYYPLKSSGKVYKPVQYSALSVFAPDNNFMAACLISEGEPGAWNSHTFTDSLSLVKSIKKLPDKSWIISYGVDYISSILYDTISRFTRVSGWGDKTNYIELKSRQGLWYLIDIRIFFAHGLQKVGRLLYSNDLPIPDPSAGIDVIMEYVNNEAGLIDKIWVDFSDLLHDKFNVYPSKSPGSTALKIYKTTIGTPLKTKGTRLKRAVRNSLHAGALHWTPGIYDNAYLYDINASYPFAMGLTSYPRYYQGFAYHDPPSPFWIATVKLSYQCNYKFSPLHIPAMDNLHYSVDHAENVVTSLNYIDFQTLSNMGQLIIHEWMEGVYWTPDQSERLFTDWKDRIEGASLESTTNKTMLKIVSRALHSKFSQNRLGQRFTIRKIKPSRVNHTRNVIDLYPLKDGGLAIKTSKKAKDKFIPYDMPEYESLTLSMGRALVYSAVDEHTIYVDTDCIISTVERPDLFQGPNFGAWKLQESGACAIAGPRMYAFDNNVKSSGIYTPDRQGLRGAIWDAAAGKESKLEAVEGSSMLDFVGGFTTRSHTIKRINYPYVEVIDNLAYVTRSPTVQVQIMELEREFTL